MKKVIGPLTLLLCSGFAVYSQAPAKQIKKVPVRATASVDGKSLFGAYCAVCHGSDAKGGGPAASALNKGPGDLTTLTQKNGGKYPEVRVSRAISGEVGVIAHGNADMPVWGPLFKHMSSNEDLGAIRIYNLTKYIETLQK
jgi:mono/diheme cytochrome c family protein